MNEWYNTLNKPLFTPPASYFPIAWGILYTLMTIAFFIVVFKPQSQYKYIAINLFLIQLFLNFIWSYMFFQMQSIILGLIDVVLLLIALVFTMYYFLKVSKIAFLLLVPYLLQVIFALYLNLGFAILNK